MGEKGQRIRSLMLTWLFGISLFVLTGSLLSDLVRQKWNYSENNAAQFIVQGYYEEPARSLDVLFLGASTVRNGMSPMQMYEEYGFTGYSRATSVQAPVISYNLLLETMETQDLKAVVIDATSLVQKTDNLEEMEGKYHEAIDYMPMSKYKWNIISQITQKQGYSPFDFLFPVYRYHDRWSELEKQDFTYQSWRKDYPYKGQYPILTIKKYAFTDDYMKKEILQDTNHELDNESAYYFDQIAAVCSANDIELVMIKTPVSSWDWAKHDLVERYAELSGASFIDFNLPGLREEIGFDPASDFCDDGRHPNITGARKMSSYVGNYLMHLCNLEDRRGVKGYEKWQEGSRLYDRLLYARTIMEEPNLISCLNMLDREGYTVVIAVRNDTSKYFTEEVRQAFAGLGLKIDVSDLSYQNYLAVVSDGEVYFEQQSTEKEVSFCGAVNGLDIAASSFADALTGNNAGIMIDQKDVSPQGKGFNVVVYDNEVGQVVARRSFNTGRDGKLYTLKK